ncbi:MAG: outer membrane protein assembly factor BamA, partial [Gemmatimonadales bacterium]
MSRRLLPSLAIALILLVPRPASAQEELAGGQPDSVFVVGAKRVSHAVVLQTASLVPGRFTTYRDIQRALRALYATGQFDDVRIDQDTTGGRQLLTIVVRERPILARWTVRGVERVSEGAVRSKVALTEGRPIDPAAVARARGGIDSLYRARGYYLAEVRTLPVYEADSSRVRLVFDITEGRRVAIARVDVQGNTHFPDPEIVSHLSTRPEGFWWWRKGEYDDEKLRADLQERLPKFYGDHGFVDFQVLSDTLLVSDATGKAELVVRVSEGEPYHVGTFEIVGNRRFSTDDLEQLYPFRSERRTGMLGLGGVMRGPAVFHQARWDEATSGLYSLYHNEGYIYAQVRPDVIRRTDASGRQMVDLRWVINEGQPAIVNRVEIVGNDITHERVIRDQIVLLPGDLFRQDALLRSYQNISNLGFFNQPLPPPETPQANDQGDIDVIFHVTEKHTGNVNFGASVGQGTGLGGFLGLEEPNLFGQGKRGRFQWQFGKNINDFDLSFTDPAIRESRISGTISLHNTRLRYNIADLGRVRRRGASLQLGFPVFHDRYARMFVSYGIDEQTYTGSSTNSAFSSVFNCRNCVRSTIGVSLLRDTRIDLPFATAGTMASVGISQSGGPLGGTGNFQRVDLEARWHAPLAQLGGRTGGNPLRLVLGLSSRSGFVFGDAPFFDQLFSLGGTQFGIPLRGYDEFAITPLGYDPFANSSGASPNAFGKAYFLMTGEIGVRVSQMFYLNAFYDAGNLWSRAIDYNPTRLFRGAGIGLDVISPLGPLGLDWAYGFDKTDALG